MARPDAQEGEDALEYLLVACRQGLRGDMGLVLDQVHELASKLAHGKHHVGQSRRNRAARHGRIFRFIWVLHQNKAAGLFDGFGANRSVRASPSQDHGESVAMLVREGAEKQVDRRTPPARFVERQAIDLAVDETKLAVRRNDINIVPLKRHPLIDLANGNVRLARQYLREFARMRGLKMHDHDIGRARIWRDLCQKALQGAQAARGRADPYDSETRLHRLEAIFLTGKFSFLGHSGSIPGSVFSQYLNHRWPQPQHRQSSFLS